jgi:hypothetical protein
MRPVDNGMMLVRAELCERLATLQNCVGRCSALSMYEQTETIRTLASAYGLTPVARLAEAMGRAARDAGACPPSLYLARLKDAIGCERLDEAAAEAMLASVSVRLCG